jgi:hypothetical protein
MQPASIFAEADSAASSHTTCRSVLQRKQKAADFLSPECRGHTVTLLLVYLHSCYVQGMFHSVFCCHWSSTSSQHLHDLFAICHALGSLYARDAYHDVTALHKPRSLLLCAMCYWNAARYLSAMVSVHICICVSAVTLLLVMSSGCCCCCTQQHHLAISEPICLARLTCHC